MTPIIAKQLLWFRSGHMDKYDKNIFITKNDDQIFVMRPMNCPTCVQMYNFSLKSYRDLPIKMVEFGVVHRKESSGSLHGLLRVQSFTQDDGHIFCKINQLKTQVLIMIRQFFEVYHDFGFRTVSIRLALRPKNRIGSYEDWNMSEKVLFDSLNSCGIKFYYLYGEGAFYGPKIEFHLKDSIDRSWQCGTIQIDFSMPGLLEAFYIDVTNKKRVPVMLHRAIVGSLERFYGMLLEHYSNKLPLWLSPIQVILIGVKSINTVYIKKIHNNLLNLGIRSQIDLRNQKIGFKIRNHTLKKVPFIAVIGSEEEASGKISVRKKNGINLGLFSVYSFNSLLKKELLERL
jgi:threonyl-tRNA synthetase